MRTLITDVVVVDGSGGAPFKGEVVLVGTAIDQVGRAGELAREPGDMVVDGGGRTLMPGLIDAHSHTDGLLFDPEVQLALLRQGVTTVIGGQDGVSYAPGNGDYATEYFAAINGAHPTYRGDSVAELLTTFDGTTPLNFGYLVPAGTVRYEVMGRGTEAATEAELATMRALVQAGMDDGALGISSGLDYVPGIFASTAELAELCRPLADAGGVYVSHMRGGYEDNSSVGIDEIIQICTAAGVPAHVSHFHATADILRSQLDALEHAGVDATFDAYPYTRGCSLLTMPFLPPWLSVQTTEQILEALADPQVVAELRVNWFPLIAKNASLGPKWADMLTLAHIAAPEFAWAQGLTLAEAAERASAEQVGLGVPVDAVALAVAVLWASRLEVNVVMKVPHERDDAELAKIFTHPGHIGGSDGIFVGAHPHPRARGTFARYLHEFTAVRGDYDLAMAAVHLSSRPAERFSLGRRGRVAPGYVADLVLLDPAGVRDAATYASPMAIATGIEDVFVAGERVLADGALTGALPGAALRRELRDVSIDVVRPSEPATDGAADAESETGPATGQARA